MKRMRMIICSLALVVVLCVSGAALAEPVTIVISAVGDCTLGGDSKSGGEARFRKKVDAVGGDYGYFLQLVKPIFDADDFTVANLEGLLTKATKKRPNRDFNFRGDPEYAKILSMGGVEVANLANNHLRDFLEQGINDTVAALEAEGVGYFGYTNLCVRESQGVKVGFAGFYEYETESILDILSDLRGQCDVMIVSFHWGKEGSNGVSKFQMEMARKAIDAGADLVIGHHPHVIQGMEQYAGKTIAYSLGNFCFGGNGNPKDKDTFILQCAFTLEDGVITGTETSVIPCSVTSEKGTNNFQPMPLSGEDAERVMKRLREYSKKFDVPGVPAA